MIMMQVQLLKLYEQMIKVGKADEVKNIFLLKSSSIKLGQRLKLVIQGNIVGSK